MSAPAAGTRWRLGDVPVDRVTFDEALEAIGQMIRRGEGGAVYTPNVDHVVLAREHEGLRRAYQEVDLSVADGMPVVWASRLLGAPVPEKISGSDLVPRLMGRAEQEGWRVYLLGGGPGVAVRAADMLRVSHPRLSVVGATSPRIEMTDGPAVHAALMAGVREVAPHVVLVGLGAPKQELFIHQVRRSLRPAVLLGVGATLDFMAGVVPRAPRWISSAGLEWAYRLAREPRRMWRRYLVRDPRFVSIVVRDLVRS
ncbi:MAG TPA: WecB/TagA/CpsF family glycosyltransferase [Polyangiaceae bacterium]|nr:WecB/TagA/CpsF family glycosyltransferase [Polyangiaceae bacterium]